MMNSAHAKTPAQSVVDETAAITKRAPENDTDSTLPNPHAKPNSNLRDSGLSDGSVMWAGPDPLGDGARSAGPHQQSTENIDPAMGVTEPVIGNRLPDSGASVARSADEPTRTSLISSAQLHSHTQPCVIEIEAVNDTKFDAENAYEVDTSQTTSSPFVQVSSAENKTADGGMHPNIPNKAIETFKKLQKALREQGLEEGAWPEARWGQTKEEAFIVVKQARAMIDARNDERSRLKATNASQNTIDGYQSDCANLDRQFNDLQSQGATNWMQVLARHAPVKKTFLVYKAALMWRAAEQVRRCLSDQDNVQRAVGHSVVWSLAVTRLQAAIEHWLELQAIQHDACLQLSGESPKASKSKKRILKKLPDDWQLRFLELNSNSPTYRHAGILLRFCGLRSEELHRGASVRWTQRGIRVFIRGAKVRDVAGQPWRSFVLNPAVLPAWFVQELEEKRYVRIRVNKDNLRAHLARMSDAVFNPEKRKNGCNETLSVYVFRHALATEMREAGWESVDIAAAIGEIRAATASLYGHRVRGGKKAKPNIAFDRSSIQTARPVENADTQGLQKLNTSSSAKPK